MKNLSGELRKSRVIRKCFVSPYSISSSASPSRLNRAYWFHYSNDNPKRAGVFDGFGHYEDELVKVKGRWLFAKRRIYNENRAEWAYKGGKNPAW